MSNEKEHDRALDRRVRALAHELAEAINTGEGESRLALREAAIELLHGEVQASQSPPPAPARGPFNPFGIGIPLLLMGGVLILLFPPVGLLMFVVAAGMLAWGVGATLFARR